MFKKLSALALVGMMVVGLLAIVGCNQGPGNQLQPPPPAPNREEQRQSWDFPRPSDVNVVMDHYPVPLHTLEVVGTEFVTENTRVAPLAEDQINISIMNENTLDTIRYGNETTPFGMYEAIRAWEATHGGTVTVRVTPLDQQDQMLRTGVAAADPPDLIQLYKGGFPRWPAQGLLQSMLTFEDHLNLYYNTIWDELAMEHFRWNGHYFGMVANYNARNFRNFTLFNQRLFDEAGITTPFEHYQAGTWNWSQFVSSAGQIQAHLGEAGVGFSGWGLFVDRGPYPIMRIVENDWCECCGEEQREAVTEDEINGFWPTEIQLAFDDPGYINWLTEVANFKDSGSAALGWNLQQWRADLPRNTVGMVFGSLDHMQSMVEQSQVRRNTGSNIRIAPMPIFDPNNHETSRPVTHMLAHAIPTHASADIGAAEFIRLNSIIGLNIRAYEEENRIGWYWNYLTSEEREMINNNMLLPAFMCPSEGVGRGIAIVEGEFNSVIINPGSGTAVSALMETVRPLLMAEINEFNRNTRN